MTARSTGARASVSVIHVALLLPWIMAVVAARLPIRDSSFLWHVAAGRMQIETGAVLTADPFSFTFGGADWRTQSWLLELLYGFLDNWAGLFFVGPFVAATAAATFALVLLTTFRRTKSLPASVIVGAMTAWLSAAFLSPRPVLASYLLLALVVAAAGERRLRWTLPLIGYAWAAVHGSFVLGVGYVALLAVARRDRRLMSDAIVMGAVSVLTAHGLGTLETLIDFARSREALGLIVEWATPNFIQLALFPFFVGLVLLMAAGLRGGLKASDFWVIVPFLAFALTATRAVLPAWIVLAPMAGTALTGIPVSARSGERERRVLVAVAVGLLVFPLLLPIQGGSGLSDTFPAEAVEHLTADRVFHDDFVGGYVIYRFDETRPIFIDDRAELYGADHLSSMIEARNGMPEWAGLFDRWAIEQALVRTENGLAEVLRSAGWTVDYEDDDFVVFSAG